MSKMIFSSWSWDWRKNCNRSWVRTLEQGEKLRLSHSVLWEAHRYALFSKQTMNHGKCKVHSLDTKYTRDYSRIVTASFPFLSLRMKNHNIFRFLSPGFVNKTFAPLQGNGESLVHDIFNFPIVSILLVVFLLKSQANFGKAIGKVRILVHSNGANFKGMIFVPFLTQWTIFQKNKFILCLISWKRCFRIQRTMRNFFQATLTSIWSFPRNWMRLGIWSWKYSAGILETKTSCGNYDFPNSAQLWLKNLKYWLLVSTKAVLDEGLSSSCIRFFIFWQKKRVSFFENRNFRLRWSSLFFWEWYFEKSVPQRLHLLFITWTTFRLFHST